MPDGLSVGRRAGSASGAGGLYDPSNETRRVIRMTDRTYRVTEIVGTSTEGIDAAIRNGIRRAGETLRHLDWFEVTEIRGHLVDNAVDHVQVGLKLGFRLEDS
jgi:dodecin